MHELFHPLLHGFLDTLKSIPFLFLAYLLMEFLEHKASDKMEGALKKIGCFSPAVGSLLGCVPQCGFSASASNLYTAGVITEGTLIAVFLATSDEAIPVLLSNPSAYGSIWKLIVAKIVIGILVGFGVDITLKLLKIKKVPVDMCESCGCDEEESIWLPALKHTLRVGALILAVNIALGYIIHFVGEDRLGSLLLSSSYFQPFISALVGLIPNCAVSAVITELYVEGALSFGSAISGLCSGAGMGLVVLFRTNKIKKENLRIVITMYLSSALIGALLMLLGIN